MVRLSGGPLWTVLATPRFRWLLAGLLAGDVIFGLLHLANAFLRHDHPDALIALPMFNLGTDRGLGEIFGYGKLVACAVFAWRLFKRRGSAAYAAASVFYLLALVDDSIAIHEYIGHHVAFISPNHRIGEFVTLTLAAATATALFLWALRNTRKADAVFGLSLLALFGLLAAFAGLLDLLHVPVILEEGAELTTLSLHCAFLAALHAWVVARSAPFSSPE